MFQDNQTSIFKSNPTQFLLIFAMFFSLLFVSAGWLLVDNVYLFTLRKYAEPEINKEFGFSSENQTFYYGDQKITGFIITKVEKGGLMDAAGFRPNDLLYLNVGCRFFYLNKSDEAIFYGILSALKDGQTRKFEVLKAEDFAPAAKLRLDPYEKRRSVILEKRKISLCREN